MKVCPKCGMPFDDEVINCKRCGIELLEMPEEAAPMSPQELRERRKKDWIWLGLGVPAFMLLIWGIYTIMGKLLQAG